MYQQPNIKTNKTIVDKTWPTIYLHEEDDMMNYDFPLCHCLAGNVMGCWYFSMISLFLDAVEYDAINATAWWAMLWDVGTSV